MGAATNIAVASLGVAIVAAGLSLWSAMTANRAHLLAVAQNEERGTPLRVYLADGYLERNPTNGNRHLAFLLSVTNSATLENSVANLDLRVHFRNPANHLAMVDLRPDDGATVRGSGLRLGPPVHLAPRQTVTGWVAYAAPASIFKGHHVDQYEVRVTDANGRVASWKTVHVKEVYPNDAS